MYITPSRDDRICVLGCHVITLSLIYSWKERNINFDIKFDIVFYRILYLDIYIIMIRDVCSFRVVFYVYKCIIMLMRDVFFENVFNGLHLL